MNWYWVRETLVPVLWLWAAFVIIGASVGVWMR